MTHVPTIYVDGREITVEKYTKEEFLSTFRDIKESTALSETKENTGESSGAEEHGGGCGPTGCSIF